MERWRRYVAIGDSFTEGLDDPGTGNRHLGWADRVARELARSTPDLEYANLAIRGRLLEPIMREQLPAALALEPDLISIAGGVNDALRPHWDLAAMAMAWDEGLARARSGGAHVVIVTFGQPSRRSRTMGAVENRLREYRDVILDLARRHGCTVTDFWYAWVFDDPRLWAADRLHLNPAGHERVAAAVLDDLGIPTWDWRAPLPHEAPPSVVGRVSSDAAWLGTHLAPWIGRRILGRSSGDGVSPKYPQPVPAASLS